MGKTKIPATGGGHLGKIMARRLTRIIGLVENVIEAKPDWALQLALKLKNEGQPQRFPRAECNLA